MKKDPQLSLLGAEMVAGLAAFCDALESGDPIETHAIVRPARRDLPTKPDTTEDPESTQARQGPAGLSLCE